MSVLVDTNVLLRQFEPAHPHHRAAVESTIRLITSGEAVHVTAQNIAEFWAAATRSPAQNGLGLAVAVATAALAHFERVFTMLPDDPGIYNHWKRLVTMHGIIGNKVYDVRLVAAMAMHGVARILTFNTGDFVQYGVEVIHPSGIL